MQYSAVPAGDRTCASIIGINPLEPTRGAFAQHVGNPTSALLRIPANMSFETATALCTCFIPSGLALFQSLQLPGSPAVPSTKPLQVLVYGGATAIDTATIQFLRLAGFVPIVTCSPHSNELVKSYGAAAAFDYKGLDCTAQIRRHTKNGLDYALDCVTTRDSMQIGYASLGRAGGRYTALDQYPEDVAAKRKIFKADWVIGSSTLGIDIEWPAPHGRNADPEAFQFGVRWKGVVQDLLDQG